MRKLLVAAALTALAAPGRLHAQPAADDKPIEIPAHRAADARGAAGEHGPRRPRLFISPSGEPFRGPAGLEAWFAQADADHDGAITLAEFQADALRAFRLYDANGDGVLDGFEIQAYEQERVPEIGEITLGDEREGEREGRRRRGRGNEAAAGGQGAARYGVLNEPQPLLAADEDVDGKVTAAEWTRATARRFAKLDRDHSGRITLEKLKAAPPKR